MKRHYLYLMILISGIIGYTYGAEQVHKGDEPDTTGGSALTNSNTTDVDSLISPSPMVSESVLPPKQTSSNAPQQKRKVRAKQVFESGDYSQTSPKSTIGGNQKLQPQSSLKASSADTQEHSTS